MGMHVDAALRQQQTSRVGGMQVTLSFLPKQVAALEAGLFQMPVTSGQVPAIFADPEGDDEDPDEVAALHEHEQQGVVNGAQPAAANLCNPEMVDD